MNDIALNDNAEKIRKNGIIKDVSNSNWTTVLVVHSTESESTTTKEK